MKLIFIEDATVFFRKEKSRGKDKRFAECQWHYNMPSVTAVSAVQVYKKKKKSVPQLLL